jgi:hypothetical protein
MPKILGRSVFAVLVVVVLGVSLGGCVYYPGYGYGGGYYAAPGYGGGDWHHRGGGDDDD